MLRAGASCLLAATGGALSATAFTSWASPLTAPTVVAAIALAVRSSSGPAQSAVVGGCAGTTFMGGVLLWMWPSLGMGAWVALTLVQAAFFVALGAAVRLVMGLPGWPGWVAALWTAVEGLRSTWPLGGMPWGRLGFAAPDTPWAALLPLVGVTGAGFVMALIAGAVVSLVDCVRRSDRRLVFVTAGLIVIVTAPALVIASRSDDPTTTRAQVGIVQGGVPGSGTRLVDHHREVTDNHVAETTRLAARQTTASRALRFVLWPENATAVDPIRDERARRALMDAVAATGTPIVAGAVTDGPRPGTALNQALVWTDAGAQERYTKQHLVPFGEYVPFRALASRVSDRVAAIRRDMVPGSEAAPLSVAGLAVATALCFDIAYDDVLRPQVATGAQLVAVLTSNAMFLGTGQLEQQWTITRARAIESRRAVVVASVNGVSGAIGPDGKVLDRLSTRSTGSTTVDVPLGTGVTLAYRLGPWPGRALTGFALLGVVLGLFRVRRPVSHRHMVSRC